MLFKMNPSFGGGGNFWNARKKTLNETGRPWHIEFYKGNPYGEAGFFSPATLPFPRA